MIIFVTNNEDYKQSLKNDLLENIITVNENKGIRLFFGLMSKKRWYNLDIEATGLDPYYSDLILFGISYKDNYFMFDYSIDLKPILEHIIRYNIMIIGHNLKYDISILYAKYNILLTKVYDTMIAEQRLYMRGGLPNGLKDLIERYTKKVVLKDTRNEFIGVDKNTFKIQIHHLLYLKGDLAYLTYIKGEQKKKIKEYRMQFLLYGIEFPLINIIALAECTGFNFDIKKWKEKIDKNKKLLLETEILLDEELKKLIELKKDYTIDNIPLKTLFANMIGERKDNGLSNFINEDGTTEILDLFGEVMSTKTLTGLKKKISLKPANAINYSSKKEIVTIFGYLGEVLPSNYGYSVPNIKNGKITSPVNNFTIKADTLQRYLIERPDIITKNFIKLLIQYNGITTALSNFGLNYINKVHKITNNIHTKFRQCAAATGRFQSGGGKNEQDKYNAQNIPRDLDYRECFHGGDDYSIITADFSGAELLVMASHAQDFKLIEMSKRDMHSEVATTCWRNIFSYRVGRITLALKTINSNIEFLLKELDILKEKAKTFIVNKTMKERTDFKPMTFGTIYGMYAKKAGETLNISQDEGKIVINTIKSIFPATFKMVEEASKIAENRGFVILNNRTFSRAWFPILIQQLKKEISKDTHFIEISNELSAARNIRIQGTQADFVKEATVVLVNYFRRRNLDITILSWVHDEIVFKIPNYLNENHKNYIPNYRHKVGNKYQTKFNYKGEQFENIHSCIKYIMEEVANRYLVNVKINVDTHIGKTWTK